MAGALSRRVDALEGKDAGIVYPVAWIIAEVGESAEDARARYEAEHGPIGERSSITWICTGVPRNPEWA